MDGLTLDAGALIAIDRSDRRMTSLLKRARETDAAVTIPATALAQAIRNPQRQVRLARILKQPTTTIVSLDHADASLVGRILASSGTSDIADAHVVICAHRADQPIVTTDPRDLTAIDPTLTLLTL